MGLDEDMLVPVESLLVAFDRTRVLPKGIARLMVYAAEKDSACEFPCNREQICI